MNCLLIAEAILIPVPVEKKQNNLILCGDSIVGTTNAHKNRSWEHGQDEKHSQKRGLRASMP